MAKIAFTASRVAKFQCPADKSQAFLWDSSVQGLGLRATPGGKPAYVFQAVFQGKDIRLTIGSPNAWTIPLAQSKARELQRMIDEGRDPRDLKRGALAQAKAKDEKKQEEEKCTLKCLLAHYCDYLEALGRRSHKDARSIFALHVNEAWPTLAALPANQVTFEHVADMMRRLHEAGKGRTSNKLRSYLRAAYQVAKASRSKASIPMAFKTFNVINNPAADTEPDESQNKADKKPLSAGHMRAYWQAIKSMPDLKGAVLRLHLLTGAQRIEQLVNLKTADITEASILIFDGKGRPGKGARPHLLPLIPLAAVALADCRPRGIYALSTDDGTTHLSASTFSDWASAAAIDIPDFEAKRIRSGVETVLASLKVSKDDRGRLQSHGITGVQARHYDGHEYTDEKREALEKLLDFVAEDDSQSVTAI